MAGPLGWNAPEGEQREVWASRTGGKITHTDNIRDTTDDAAESHATVYPYIHAHAHTLTVMVPKDVPLNLLILCYRLP